MSPPSGGSTLLNEIISTSKNVSNVHQIDTREGQTLPKVRELMFDIGSHERWDEKTELPWEQIKKEWRKYWDVTKPVLLEKSPPNIVRATAIEEHFQPAYFICLVRNPYALCESINRRAKSSFKRAAERNIEFLTFQKKNLESLENVMLVSYESLTDLPSETAASLAFFLPELADMQFDGVFNAHNFKKKKMKITNLNTEKIGKISLENLEIINAVFIKNKALLDWFGYEIIATDQEVKNL